MEKRALIAIVLSFVVLLSFNFLFPKNQGIINQYREPKESQQIINEEQSNPFIEKELTTLIDVSGAENISIFDEEHETEIVFSNIGAEIKNIFVLNKNNGQKELLYDNKETGKGMLAIESAQIPGLNVRKYNYEKTSKGIEFTTVVPGAVEIKKTIKFSNSFSGIGLEVSTKNLSEKELFFSYRIKGPSEIEKVGIIAGRNFTEAAILIDDKIEKIKPNKKAYGEKEGDIAWVAIKNRYYVFLMKNLEPIQKVYSKLSGKESLALSEETKTQKIRNGEIFSNNYILYLGPLDYKALGAIAKKGDLLVDYGMFGGVSKVLLNILNFFHNITKNWGVSIICLTILMNLILFPLTIKSFRSMHQMKQLQPHMQKLKVLHKDDPQRLNKETMELYKKYNINPLGGCLPMILQMPVFIALYQGLMRSLALKGSTFLWVKDLGTPDAAVLPFSLPFIGNTINILPLFMVIMMVVQQKITQASATDDMPPEQKSQQKMMAITMPLVFGVLFYKMPSGLVLYWLTNTILMTIEQGMIAKQMEQ